MLKLLFTLASWGGNSFQWGGNSFQWGGDSFQW